ncbi:MAG: lamin tail domain-containing protein, partial [Microbacteriaceae bacterium]|nr:lamin tail domain-containing protein [Burkholderiaceae bacterium]
MTVARQPLRRPLRPPLRLFLAQLATALPLVGLGLGLAAPAGAAVVISQVYGGGGNTGATLKHDFIELFNNGSAPAAIGGWSVQYAGAASTGWSVTTVPAGTTLQPGRYLLVRQAQGSGGTVDVNGDVIGTIAMSGASGKVALANNSTAFSGTVPLGAIDFVGYGAATTAEGSPTALLTNPTSAQRNANGCTDSNDNSADFTVALAAPRNAASPAHLCGGPSANLPIVTTCPAASVAAGSAASLSTSATDPDSLVTRAAAVGAWPAGFSLGSFTAAQAAGGTATQAVTVAATTPPATYTLALQWTNSDAQTASCSLAVTIAGITPIYSIQGSGDKSPFEGQTVLTSGVVSLLTNNGFFLQDLVGDGNPLTSDGIFVFTSTTPAVSAGQRIQLSGQVAEFNTGATDANARSVTELVSPSGITVLGSGYSLVPVLVTLPVAVAGELERYEGMLVTLSGPLTVVQNYFQGRFGQLTLAAGGRLETPTNRFRPGPQAAALADANGRRTILLDDGASTQNPNPIPYLASGARSGDATGAITGVIDYGLATSSNPGPGLYKIHPVAAPVFSIANPRTAAPDAVGGNLKVASFNVLNYFAAYINGGG